MVEGKKVRDKYVVAAAVIGRWGVLCGMMGSKG